ncbi:MAG: uroporphyrin-III C-methyltransferase [Candidatus Poriferisodalaceae bacterium]|jgi:uroporphyrin-III C-methyltransferase
MTVWLVGVGPGEAELMTVKAARLLGEADAVVYDRLIGDDVLSFVSPAAEQYDVGKTPGHPGPTQQDINDLLVSLGTRLSTVVRVKGGDPFVFGRGIEEARACRSVGLEVNVVPGITSALAGPMAAGISVTERRTSSGVCVVTAEQGQGSTPLDWSAIAATGLSVVVLMGARRAGEVRDRLLAGGLSAGTPAAAISRVSRPDEHVWRGPLGLLGRTPVAGPAVLVIGEVAASLETARLAASEAA